jgi:hypothetical protein
MLELAAALAMWMKPTTVQLLDRILKVKILIRSNVDDDCHCVFSVLCDSGASAVSALLPAICLVE